MKCNGCGGEFETLGGFFGYGDARTPLAHDHPTLPREVELGTANYVKTLCPRCQHVLKDILLRSDLSEHWHKYEWTLQGEAYTEEYND